MYFIAVVCPPPLSKKVLQYKYWMRDHFGCTVALKSPAHITLIPPFWLSEAEEEKLLNVLEIFSINEPDVTIQTNGFSHFGKRVLFVAVEDNPGLEKLKNRVQDHFLHYFSFIKKDIRPFHPHITIANRDMKPSHFEKAWEQFSKKDILETFDSKAISLLKLVDGKWQVVKERTW